MPVPNAHGLHARTLLRDDVYTSIRDAIVRGEFAPGETLRDSELEHWLGVSRTPIREALLRLARNGLVEAHPGRATRVCADDPALTAHARQIAAELHALAVKLAAPALTAADLRRMREANDALRVAMRDGDAEAAIGADDAFHAVPLQRAGNPLLESQLESVTLMLRRAEFLHFGSMIGTGSEDQHEQIVVALEAGDGERAAEASRTNWLDLGS